MDRDQYLLACLFKNFKSTLNKSGRKIELKRYSNFMIVITALERQTGDLTCIIGLHGLHSGFQASCGCRVRPCLHIFFFPKRDTKTVCLDFVGRWVIFNFPKNTEFLYCFKDLY